MSNINQLPGGEERFEMSCHFDEYKQYLGCGFYISHFRHAIMLVYVSEIRKGLIRGWNLTSNWLNPLNIQREDVDTKNQKSWVSF